MKKEKGKVDGKRLAHLIRTLQVPGSNAPTGKDDVTSYVMLFLAVTLLILINL